MPARKRTIVHLGNTGYLQGHTLPAEKTRAYAARFPGFRFVGIDRRHVKPAMANWKQIKAGFRRGLERLENSSVDLITSKMSLGHYDSGGREHQAGNRFLQTKRSAAERRELERNTVQHTAETLETAFKKLRRGGKMLLVVGLPGLRVIEEALPRTSFKGKMRSRQLTGRETRKTFGERNYYGDKFLARLEK